MRWIATIPVLLIALGCRRPAVTHQTLKPGVDSAVLPSSDFGVALQQLREQHQNLETALLGFERNKDESFRKLKEALGDEYERLVRATPAEVGLYFGRERDSAVAVYASAVAAHAANIQAAESHLEYLRLAIAKGETHERIAEDFASLGEFHDVYQITAFLDAVSDQQVNLPQELTDEETEFHLKREFATVREEEDSRRAAATRARKAAEQVRLAAEQEAARRQQAEEEANRRAIMAAARRDAERQAEQEARQQEARDQAMALRLYAAGYHTFYRGNYLAAEELLNEAIERYPDDARFYFYRGLARYRIGRVEEAKEDFRLGGQLEERGAFGVGRALERVQGTERTLIERFRP